MNASNGDLTPAEASRLSGAQRSYLYNLISSGVLKSRVKAGRRFISRASFDRWHEAYKVRRHFPSSAQTRAETEAVA